MTKNQQYEYEQQIKDLQDLNAKLRFKNKILENDIEKQKVKASIFCAKTIKLLLGIGLKYKDIHTYYEIPLEVSCSKNDD